MASYGFTDGPNPTNETLLTSVFPQKLTVMVLMSNKVEMFSSLFSKNNLIWSLVTNNNNKLVTCAICPHQFVSTFQQDPYRDTTNYDQLCRDQIINHTSESSATFLQPTTIGVNMIYAAANIALGPWLPFDTCSIRIFCCQIRIGWKVAFKILAV